MLTSNPSRLTTLYEAIRSLGSPLTVPEAINSTLKTALQLVNAERGLGLRLHEYHPEFELCAVSGLDDATARQVAKAIAPLARQVKLAGQGILISNTQNDLRLQSVAPLVSRTVVLIPMQLEYDEVDVLCLDREVHAGVFADDDLAQLEILTNFATVAIQSALAHEQAQQVRSEFVSVMAHEIHVPLVTIKGYSELLLLHEAKTLEDEHRFIATIRKNVGSMSTLVCDLLDITRIEGGRLHLAIEAVDVAACIEEVFSPSYHPDPIERALIDAGIDDNLGFRSHAEAEGQTISARVSSLPLVYADKGQLTQILHNLISNAHQYTPSGGQITVTGRVQDEFVRIAVTDTGIGISPNDQAKVFTKYFRADNPLVYKHPGHGLGLFIAKHLVELMGGEIGVESEPGKGSTFWFILPVTPREHEKPAPFTFDA